MGAVALVARVACVFALLGLTLWALSRWDGRAGKVKKRRAATPLRVVASVRLAKGAAVSVVEVGGQELVLGVTDGQVSLLSSGTTPAPDVRPDEARRGDVERTSREGATGGFADVLRDAESGAEHPLQGRADASPTSPAAPAGATTAPVPPTAAEFLGHAWKVARRRPVVSTTVSEDAVREALTAVGAHPRTHVPQPADGSAAPARRTDARPHQEQAWPPGTPSASPRGVELPVP